MNVLIADQVERQCEDILRSEGIGVETNVGLSEEGLIAIIDRYEGVVVRSATRISANVIAAGKKLKVIGRAGAGVDTIDVAAATRKGIIVLNTPGGNTISTAEHTMSMMLALARNIPQANLSVKEGKWERKKFVGMELQGKTMGIVGLGKVGREVATRARAFGMTVVGYDPLLSREAALELGAELVDLPELFHRSDVITLHTPLTAETRGLIGRRTLAECKPGVRILNCARGEIIDDEALLEALENGQVGGVALDVFSKEPPGVTKVISHPLVIATPHLGASTDEAQEKVAAQIARQIADVLHGRGVVGSVNADVISMTFRSEIKPYLSLAEKMGNFLIQLMDGNLRRISLRLHGKLLNEAGEGITAALLKGIVGLRLSEPVNYLNAPLIARERGILVERASEPEHLLYSELIGIEYESDKERRSFSGTVFGSSTIRLVEVDGFHFEVRPEGHLLLYSNLDKPGILAAVSGILSRSHINIAGVSLGRYGVGTRALTVMNLDSSVPPVILDEIRHLEGLLGVRLVEFDA